MTTFNWFIFLVAPVGFGSFERYVGITFVGEKKHFSILFSTSFRVCKINIEKPK
jgi:hypothetical protein